MNTKFKYFICFLLCAMFAFIISCEITIPYEDDEDPDIRLVVRSTGLDSEVTIEQESPDEITLSELADITFIGYGIDSGGVRQVAIYFTYDVGLTVSGTSWHASQSDFESHNEINYSTAEPGESGSTAMTLSSTVTIQDIRDIFADYHAITYPSYAISEYRMVINVYARCEDFHGNFNETAIAEFVVTEANPNY